MNSIRGKRWVLPLVLLLVIVTASALRWNEEASKTLEDGVLRWERDRWTGDLWLKGYLIKQSGMVLAAPNVTEELNEKAMALKNNLTLARDILAGGMVLWLVVELIRLYRRTEQEEST